MSEFADGRKAYVSGQVAEIEARLALLRCDRSTVAEQAAAASGQFDAVGALLDVARVAVLRARIDRDLAALDEADRGLRALGGLGYVREVGQARLEVEGLG